jgi:hypothetical protein
MTLVFDGLLWPFKSLPPIWGLTVISFATGLLMLWIFGKVSNQTAIKLVRDKIRGNLIGIRLFGDDLGMLFKLQTRIMGQTLRYMGYALAPLLVTLIPVLLILTQLNLNYASRPLEVGESAMVKVKLRDASPLHEAVRIDVPDGVVLETEGVRIEDPEEDLREVAWRLRADRPGDYTLTVHVGDDAAEKRLRVGAEQGRVSAIRPGKDIWEVALWPGESPFGSSHAVQSIEVSYAPKPIGFLFWDLGAIPSGWLVFFFVASIAFGFAFRGPLGVEI